MQASWFKVQLTFRLGNFISHNYPAVIKTGILVCMCICACMYVCVRVCV